MPPAPPKDLALRPLPERPQLPLELPGVPAAPRAVRGDQLLADLNAPQQEAVLSNDGPLLVLAGAGSGKTRALTRKIAWLVEVVRLAPWEVLAVTFTNKAAAEMRERCHQLLGERAADLWLGTFHSIGVRLLRSHGTRIGIPRDFVIYDNDDQETLIGRCMKRLNVSDKNFPVRAVRGFIDRQKQVCLGPSDPAIPRGNPYEARLAQLYEVYQAELKSAGAVDFGDLIWLPYVLATTCEDVGYLLRSRWRYVLVDEFQDTNRAQYLLLKAILNPERRLCAVGDDDQSIYRWRGAEVENILNFANDFPNAATIRFEQKYRSTRPILDVSGALIAKNSGRLGKVLFTDKEGGEKIRVYGAHNDQDEADWVVQRIQALRGPHRLSEMAVFYRTNAQSRLFEDRLRSSGIPYRVFGGVRFYDRAEVKDVVAYLRLALHPSDPVALERVINKPARGIGKVTLEKLAARAAREATTLWEALCAEARVSGSGQNKLLGFVELILDLNAMATTARADEVVHAVLAQTGYLEALLKDGSVEAETRAENVRELVDALTDFGEAADQNAQSPGDASLAAFLDQVALVSDLDQRRPADEDAVVLMTAHMAKGLEFDVVFVTGMEEDLMPHFNSREDPAAIEEERRLAYVAMTRARVHLHLVHAAARRRFGQIQQALRSRFLDGLPSEHLRLEGLGARTPAVRSWGSGGGGGGFGAPGGRLVTGTARPSRETWDEVKDPEPDWENESQEHDESPFKPGRRVFHPSFGEGRVTDLEGQGERAKVTVQFRDGQSRKLIAKVLTRV